MSNRPNDTLIWDAAHERRDARAAWDVIAICIRQERAFPDWVISYLADTAAGVEHYFKGAEGSTYRVLKNGLGFDKLIKPDTYNHENDPEVIFETITTWLIDGEVKDVTEGAVRYQSERLNGAGDAETVRKMFYKGKEGWKHPDPREPQQPFLSTRQ